MSSPISRANRSNNFGSIPKPRLPRRASPLSLMTIRLYFGFKMDSYSLQLITSRWCELFFKPSLRGRLQPATEAIQKCLRNKYFFLDCFDLRYRNDDKMYF